MSAGGVMLSLAFSLITAAGALAVLLWLDWNRPGPGAAQTFIVERGAGVSTVGKALQQQGLVRSATMFRLASELYARRGVKAGEYELPARASIAQILQRLVDGAVVRHMLTVAEGVTSAGVIEILANEPSLSGPTPDAPPEGSVLPETYTFERGETRAALLARMQAAQDELLDRLWSDRAPDLPLASKDEAVILASIVEKETGLAAERPLVAAVFVNRLRRGMRLESDPTIIYGITKGRPLGRGIR
ncbi:MAG: endolytic transglycosylase MltG, partial [Hyphomonadaceae bacterium]|nr:endolytic transglycosylase MltG [Hyphomonadaceae bacterium]